ncbi:putative pectinesterase inhibitor domain-containing protein [Arabidopsis thaliana]|uniref:Pectinesterase inhibitor domain-containing protein n=6 Tax=Arabidopsis TaxID=3701 RepID=A0A178W830_ARATH|nr:Plant invertase/pectin methylesterase inhibitor superfamily protein [Arabidopsis thaliana]AEE33126.1 Plant invertase/pectin methylesterase inhibitor superfamily protein [Arabidopsis thaliana]KAG7649633.1 Pectinesterase inhibitor domain [Arabidopsis thaliana x Arabidopsis arenosa]KAG7657498.1 Pectinesterase inhibitor domain [Arabidopsis suecica]OAP14619.1 hypothetical protein AXX17_AT1G49110 [Arabidopsis thaliana]|eukprot:NP_175863.2 Plant invertase/pectin methylesterase inhibitor superfamily protein [Arabidopsis thaliana]
MFCFQRKKETMKFLIYLVVFVLLFNGLTANRVENSLVQKYCNQSSKYAERYFYKFCIASLEENAESQKARNSNDLTLVGTNNALSNLTNVKRIVEKIFNERKYKGRLSKKLLQKCLKLYSEGYDALTSALKYIKVRDLFKVSVHLQKAKEAPSICEMGFNGDNKQISPMKKENDVLFDVINIPYSFNMNRHG